MHMRPFLAPPKSAISHVCNIVGLWKPLEWTQEASLNQAGSYEIENHPLAPGPCASYIHPSLALSAKAPNGDESLDATKPCSPV